MTRPGLVLFYDAVEEAPNVDAAKFIELLENARTPLYPGCEDHSPLEVVTRLLSIKSNFNMSQECYNRVLELIIEILPAGAKLPKDFYRSKRMVRSLWMEYKKIDSCRNGCMLYYKDDKDADVCRFCGADRYKITSTGRSTGARRPTDSIHYLPLMSRL